MFFRKDFTKAVDNSKYPVRLYTFTGIIEENLEYILNLVSTLEDPAVKYKNEDNSLKLAKLKADIKNDIAGYLPDEIIKIITFMTVMESVYNSMNEIKEYIKELVKYPPVGFDLSEIAIKISGIAKKAIDGFFSGNWAPELENEIFEAESALNVALRRLNKLNGRKNLEKGRIVYYAGIVMTAKGIIKEGSVQNSASAGNFSVLV